MEENQERTVDASTVIQVLRQRLDEANFQNVLLEAQVSSLQQELSVARSKGQNPD